MAKLEDKERILKQTREKQLVTYKRAPVRQLSDFSTETFQARRTWHEIFKGMQIKYLQPMLFYPAILSFKIEGEIKSFTNNKN